MIHEEEQTAFMINNNTYNKLLHLQILDPLPPIWKVDCCVLLQNKYNYIFRSCPKMRIISIKMDSVTNLPQKRFNNSFFSHQFTFKCQDFFDDLGSLVG